MSRIEIPYDEYRRLVDIEEKLSRERDRALERARLSRDISRACLEIAEDISDLSLWERVFHWRRAMSEYFGKLEKIIGNGRDDG